MVPDGHVRKSSESKSRLNSDVSYEIDFDRYIQAYFFMQYDRMIFIDDDAIDLFISVMLLRIR
jgi:hypothetical protein